MSTTKKEKTFTSILKNKPVVTAAGIWYDNSLTRNWISKTPEGQEEHARLLEAEYQEAILRFKRLRAERACILHMPNYLALKAGTPYFHRGLKNIGKGL
jgi:hypothetical protein